MHVLMPADQENAFVARDLIVSSGEVTPDLLVSSVHEQFSHQPDLEALALVDNSKPCGLITKMKLFFTLSRRFGYELHGRHPIITVAETSPLVVHEDENLDSVIDKALARSSQDMYDEIIVCRADGGYLGLLSVKQLVIQQSNALARNIMQKELATARAQELERISQVKSHFLATVTHELRSPVNAIVGLAELLKMAADSGSIELIRERIALLKGTSTNLRAVITNILDLSKIEAGKMDVAYQRVDFVPLLHEIAETTRILVGHKPVSVAISVPPTSVVTMTDPIKLRQILTNLTSNAAKFTERGAIELNLLIHDKKLEIQVTDTGIGIREKDLHILFTVFGQIEDAATKAHEGTGLGLAISKSLVRLIGGTISVASTYGKGTTFTVTIPRLSPE